MAGEERMTAQPVRRHFTVHEYYRMAEAGILREDDRVELIEGEVVEMPPIGSQHAACVDRLNWLLSQRLNSGETIIRVQSPIRLNVDTEPQPDIAIVRFREDFYRMRHPGPEEVLLLIEVADSSARYDRDIKVPLYAREGIAEVWLLDLEQQTVEVFRTPSPSGYATHLERRGDQLLTPEGLPALLLRSEEIFPR